MTSSAATILREKGRAAALAEQVKSGNVRALSRLLTLLECEHPDGTEGLRLLTLEAQPRSVIGVTGYPGAGKSTLLHVLGALDLPSRGTVILDGERIEGRTDEELAALRNRKVGFVFQFHHLLREFSALENVMMPLRIGGVEIPEARSRAEILLAKVGLSGRMHHRPGQLSGGEQQRTAVARALAMDPALILADEPSGNLDHANANRLHDLLSELARDMEIGMVVVTHNAALAGRADRVLLLEDGVLAETDVTGVVT